MCPLQYHNNRQEEEGDQAECYDHVRRSPTRDLAVIR
jgi:hypothetical protein